MMPFGLVGFARLNALLFSLFQMCQAVSEVSPLGQMLVSRCPPYLFMIIYRQTL